MDFNYDTFNNRKFVRQVKQKFERSVFTCRLKKTNCDKEVTDTYRTIIKHLTSIVRNPLVYRNEMIHITIIEIGAFIDFIGLFKESIKNVNTEDGLKERHVTYLERQKLLLAHLREINENPTTMPDFIKSKV